jgi:dihydrofolate reductase
MNYMILAVDEKNGIGINNSIPWYNTDDFKHFKATTNNQIVIMGRKTFDSLRPHFKGEILPNRTKFIVSSRDYYDNQLCYSMKDIVHTLKTSRHHDYYVIGGKTIYDSLNDAGVIDCVIVTKINGCYACDTFMDFVFSETELQYNNNTFILEEFKTINDGTIYYFQKGASQ